MELVNIYLTYDCDGEECKVCGTIDLDKIKDMYDLEDVIRGFVFGNNCDYSQCGYSYVPFDYWMIYYNGAFLSEVPFYDVYEAADGSLIWKL